MLPSIPVRILKRGNDSPLSQEEGSVVSLATLCEGQVGVLDFWHTKCTRCPAAIEKLNGLAEGFGNKNEVLWFTCALSLGDGNGEVVSDLVQDESWSELNHLFVEEKDKELCKSTFGYSAVPYYVVFDHTGRICQSGEPKSMDLVNELKSLLAAKNSSPAASETVNNGLAFDDDF